MLKVLLEVNTGVNFGPAIPINLEKLNRGHLAFRKYLLEALAQVRMLNLLITSVLRL